ncbi:hypothetical protein [Bacillus mycoides]|nr:hypothetical protein [Bacillus mycoides]
MVSKKLSPTPTSGQMHIRFYSNEPKLLHSCEGGETVPTKHVTNVEG